MKDLDESDTKSTAFSGDLRIFGEISENFDGLFHFPIKIFIWSLGVMGFFSGQVHITDELAGSPESSDPHWLPVHQQPSKWPQAYAHAAEAVEGEARSKRLKTSRFLQILQIFRRLVLGCIDSYDSEKWRIFSHFSRSTRFSHFRTALNAKFQQISVIF